MVLPLTTWLPPWRFALSIRVEVVRAIRPPGFLGFPTEEPILQLAVFAAKLLDFLFKLGQPRERIGVARFPVPCLLPQFRILAPQFRILAPQFAHLPAEQCQLRGKLFRQAGWMPGFVARRIVKQYAVHDGHVLTAKHRLGLDEFFTVDVP